MGEGGEGGRGVYACVVRKCWLSDQIFWDLFFTGNCFVHCLQLYVFVCSTLHSIVSATVVLYRYTIHTHQLLFGLQNKNFYLL